MDGDTWEKKPQGQGGSLAGAQVPSSKGIISSRQDLPQLQHQYVEACKQNHGDSTVASCHWSQCKIIQTRQLVPGKLMMKFQLSLTFIYSLYLRTICCIYKGSGQMMKSNRLFPSLRLLCSLSTHKIQTWSRSPKYLVLHFFFFQMDIRGCSESYEDWNSFCILFSLVSWGCNGKQRRDTEFQCLQ